eukprot:GHVT01061543.1.p2 GENE.GHVT01061543.1~~GHVT01061543.1.p2  ORF type:complete len:163 (+),score=31.84 GHVT01061543.1:666-1154(+)
MVSLGDFGGIATTTVVTFLRLPRARGRASPRAAAARAPGLGERQVESPPQFPVGVFDAKPRPLPAPRLGLGASFRGSLARQRVAVNSRAEAGRTKPPSRMGAATLEAQRLSAQRLQWGDLLKGRRTQPDARPFQREHLHRRKKFLSPGSNSPRLANVMGNGI